MITTNVKTLLPAQELATGMGTLNNAIYASLQIDNFIEDNMEK